MLSVHMHVISQGGIRTGRNTKE